MSDEFKENSQDAILCRYLLYHLKQEDLQDFFSQVYQTLRPEGIFCVEPYGYYKYQSALKV